MSNRVPTYQLAVIASLILAMIGFSYNVWRMEVTERNANTRTACFETLLKLAELEQLVYAAHYDRNIVEGSPRKGWVKVGLIADMSTLTSESVERSTLLLKQSWSENWEAMASKRSAANSIVESIDGVRMEIKHLLKDLK